MSDPIAEMLENVGKELAQAGVSMETLAAQATGKAGMDAPGGLSLLAAKFSPEHALWFFQFLQGYLAGAKEEKPGELPNPSQFQPQVMAALSALPLTEAERKEVLDSLLQPFEQGDATPAAEPSPKAAGQETPEQMLANLEKKAEELQAQLDAKLAELKAEPPPPEPPTGEPPKAPEPNEQAVGEVEKAVKELQQALEEAMGKLPPDGF
jgi:hypothetical protein